MITTVVGFSYLGTINPGSGAKAHTVTQRIDEDEDDTSVVGRSVDIVGIGQG
jgi:hypothetical protein